VVSATDPHGRILGFLDRSTQLLTTLNYSAIADLRLYSSLEHTVYFSQSITRFLEKASNKGYSSAFGLNSSLNHGSLPTELIWL
jgi:hypothetical protein